MVDDRGAEDRRTRSQVSDAETQREDEENTSPIAMAAAAVAAAKERFVRGDRDGGEETQESVSPFATSANTGQRSEHGAMRSKPAAREHRQTQTSVQRPVSRRARLRLVRVDPWSVMKTAFLLSIAFGIMCVVAVFVIWSVLGAANVFGSINASIEQIIEADFAIEDYVGLDRVLPFTMLIAVVDVVLLTAIATLGAFLYNLAASLLGGLEVTLAEDN